MTIDFDMLGALMIDRVSCNVKGNLIITKKEELDHGEQPANP